MICNLLLSLFDEPLSKALKTSRYTHCVSRSSVKGENQIGFAHEKSASLPAPPRAVLRGPGAASLLVLVFPRRLNLR